MKERLKETPLSPPWEAILAPSIEDMKEVDRLMQVQLQSPVTLISKISKHLIEAGGKRIRPLLLLLTTKLMGYEGTRHINLAAALEFIHTATLLHDDVVDESPQRRGQPTAQMLWGNKASILVGDFLFSRAFEGMVEDGSLLVLKILSRAASLIAQGEVLQLEALCDLTMSEAYYQEIIEAKTASLFEAACHIGAVLGTASFEETEDIKHFGRLLGCLFQITDDLLDYKGDVSFGKKRGIDFREGKVTLPVLRAYQIGCREERDFWERTFILQDQREDDFKKAQSYLEKHGVFDSIEIDLKKMHISAKKALDIFQESSERTALLKMVDFVTCRAF